MTKNIEIPEFVKDWEEQRKEEIEIKTTLESAKKKDETAKVFVILSVGTFLIQLFFIWIMGSGLLW